MIKNILFILILVITDVFAKCAYTNIRTDLTDKGYNNIKNIKDYEKFLEIISDLSIFNNIECNNGDFICQSEFYNVFNGRNYYSCDNGKWKTGKCGGISLCHMGKNSEGCACW